MAHGRSQFSPSRPPATRRVRREILVVCEGQKTEIDYFNLLETHMRDYAKIEVGVVPHGCALGTSPDQVVKDAIRRKDDRAKIAEDSLVCFPYTQVWAVFDTESRGTSHFSKVPGALTLARQKQTRAAVSRPCFEVWFVLHFKKNPPAADCYDDVADALSRILAKENPPFKYQKKGFGGSESFRQLFGIIKMKLIEAIANAAALENSAFPLDKYGAPKEQGTRVHLLINEILKAKKANINPKPRQARNGRKSTRGRRSPT